jgi:hypothetical protein
MIVPNRFVLNFNNNLRGIKTKWMVENRKWGRQCVKYPTIFEQKSTNRFGLYFSFAVFGKKSEN